MKRRLIALAAWAAFDLSHAAGAEDLAILTEAVREAGRINALALACGRLPAAAQIKNLVVQRVPKTRAMGELFEETTSAAFIEFKKEAPECPDAATLALRAESVLGRLPRPTHAVEAPGLDLQEGVITRYLLQDHNGRGVSDQDFKGRFQLITFGYTFCPDICPTTLAELAAVMKALGDDAARVQPLFVSVDPERDTPAQLKSYAEFFDKRILGLSGAPELVRKAADHFKVRYEKVREPGAPDGQYSIDHSAGIYLLGPDARFLKKFAYATPVEDIVAQLRAIISGR